MQLLLVLSALLTGLTGLITGERLIDGQQVERSAVAAASIVDAAAAIVPAAREASLPLAAPAIHVGSARLGYSAFAQPALQSLVRVDERRLE